MLSLQLLLSLLLSELKLSLACAITDGEPVRCDEKGVLLTASVTGDGHGTAGADSIFLCACGTAFSGALASMRILNFYTKS